jgi:DNA-binding IclR family transcriptional regulator
LESICQDCGETALLAVFDGRETVTVDTVMPPRSVQYVGWIGRRGPPHCTSLGKVLLAWQPSSVVEQVLRGPLARLTERTVTDPRVLEAQLESIRDSGYAVAEGEFEEGVTGIAAPVFGREGLVLATVSIGAPTFRTTQERIGTFIPIVVGAAREVSDRLGHVTVFPVAGAVEAVRA